MEPKSPQANPSPEMGAYHASEVSKAPAEATRQKPEVGPARVETHETATQTAAGPAVASPPLPPIPSLPPLQQAPADGKTQTTGHATPMVASDEDVIEKEWVDKAKKIVAETKTDPYTQEKEVSKLQADYLKKRYGKEIKLSSE